ncbi:MAG: TIGR02452 family protein, partial [Ruminococcus callidus]|nr:TIGR02452 family protein [Ruminococcus callidus]
RHGSSCGSDSIYNLHIKRAEHIVSAAIDNQAKILVLGAFGCGAFRNDPYVVSRAYKNVLDRFRTYFERIEFAIFTAGNESLNYTAFSEMFTN